MKTKAHYNKKAATLNKIPDLIECTDHCHSLGLVQKDGSVEVYANHMDGFEFINTCKSVQIFREEFDVFEDELSLDIEFVKDIKKKLTDTTEIIYWAF